jgi:hypothetical protein
VGAWTGNLNEKTHEMVIEFWQRNYIEIGHLEHRGNGGKYENRS